MKKVISYLLATILLLSVLPLNIFAETTTEFYYYTYPDGETIEYFIDEDGYECIYKNGEKIYVLLPLEKYAVSEEEAKEIEEEISCNSKIDLTPKSDETNDYVIIKTLFKDTVIFADGAVTGFMSYPSNANCLRLKTTNCKPITTGKTVNVHIYIKNGSGELSSYNYFKQNCTVTQAYAISGSICKQVNVSIVSVSGLTSCVFAVTATAG